MIADFVSRVIVIDDKKEEVEQLLKLLEKQDIDTSFFTPKDLDKTNRRKIIKNRQLFFIDLSLDDSRSAVENIAQIRRHLKSLTGKMSGHYGIVIWSKHYDESSTTETESFVITLQEKLQEDKNNSEYPTPLFIIGLKKTDYIEQSNYNSLWKDIENELKKNIPASFFLEWVNSIETAKNETISNVYSLLPNYKKQSNDMVFLLTKLALNYIGIKENQVGNYPLHIDAFKSFDEILYAELLNCQKTKNEKIIDINKQFSDNNKLTEVYTNLNKAMFIDENNINQKIVIPGNVYQVLNVKNPFKSDRSDDTENAINAKSIVIEITPPCDSSDSKKRIRARLIGGFFVDANISGISKQIDKLTHGRKDCFYYYLYPVMIPNFSKPQVLILDFRTFGAEEDQNLRSSRKYKILFRAKPKLFADILQKFSSHASRLGLSVINA